jgi:mono/diheme cytochrome c family protein
MQTYTLTKKTFLYLTTFSLLLGLAACNRDSVVDTSVKPATATPTAATVAATIAATPAVAAPTVAPMTLATPMVGTVTTTASGTLSNNGITSTGGSQQSEAAGMRRVGDFPVELSAAKTPTPETDPFPARPTPPVEMVDGKIKQHWQAPAEALTMQNPFQATPENIARGREWYNQRCADCHGKSGKGNGGFGPNLKRDGKPVPPTNLVSKVVQANSDGELFWKITNGRSPMPSNRVRFQEDQRWQMVLYLRTLK